MTLTGIIVALIMLLLGFLLGWFIEWRIDLAYWRAYFEEAQPGAPSPDDRVLVLPAGATAAQLPPAGQEVVVQALREQVAQRDADLSALRAMIEQLGTTEAQRREQEAALRDETYRLREQLDDLAAAKNDAEVEWRHELARREQQWQESREAEFAGLQTEVERLQKELADAEGRLTRMASAHPSVLSEIRGIGPKFEAELRRLGITSFDELAERTPEDLQTLLNPPKWQKPDFASWIEQARILARTTAD